MQRKTRCCAAPLGAGASLRTTVSYPELPREHDPPLVLNASAVQAAVRTVFVEARAAKKAAQQVVPVVAHLQGVWRNGRPWVDDYLRLHNLMYVVDNTISRLWQAQQIVAQAAPGMDITEVAANVTREASRAVAGAHVWYSSVTPLPQHLQDELDRSVIISLEPGDAKPLRDPTKSQPNYGSCDW